MGVRGWKYQVDKDTTAVWSLPERPELEAYEPSVYIWLCPKGLGNIRAGSFWSLGLGLLICEMKELG